MSLQRFGLALLALTLSTPAMAQTATATFDVTITIAADCDITSTQNMNFGTSGVLTAPVDQTAVLGVTCTIGTPYTVGLSAGTAVGATIATRGMTSLAGDIINYKLFRDSARLLNWGITPAVDTVASIGVGTQQNFTVYGRVLAQTTPAIGVYTDTITATVTF